MQAWNMRSDDAVFDLEDRLLRRAQRVLLPSQGPTVDVSVAGVAHIRNAGLSDITVRVNTRDGLVILRPAETLTVEPDLMVLIAVR